MSMPRSLVCSAANLLAESRPNVFVHIRRGDYVRWPSRDNPAVLPASWFTDAMQAVRSRLDKPQFVVVTDDVPYAREIFGHHGDVAIAAESWEIEFALMTLCDAGILSASSFSWWGAYLAHAAGSAGPFVAPKYWAGRPQGEWYPPSFARTSFLEFR